MAGREARPGRRSWEVLQNCVIFNDKTHADFALNKEVREENTITLRHGERMIFGRNRDKGLVQIA